MTRFDTVMHAKDFKTHQDCVMTDTRAKDWRRA